MTKTSLLCDSISVTLGTILVSIVTKAVLYTQKIHFVVLLPVSCLFHHSLFWSTTFCFDPALFMSWCPGLQGSKWTDWCIWINPTDFWSQFFFINDWALLFYTFCTSYCITISFFIEFLTSLNIKAPPYWNPVSMYFWHYLWCNHLC